MHMRYQIGRVMIGTQRLQYHRLLVNQSSEILFRTTVRSRLRQRRDTTRKKKRNVKTAGERDK